MKKLLLILFSAVALSSCGMLHINESYQTSYIRWYYLFDSISGQFNSTNNKLAFEIVNHRQLGEKNEGYDTLCEKHNDSAFNRYINDVDVSVTALAYDFESIEIVSDADFDAEHPAGTSLGDITTFVGYSFKPFIDAGYTRYEYGVPTTSYDPGKTATEIRKKVKNLTLDDLTLLDPKHYKMGGSVFNILFDAVPTLATTHNLTITLTSDDDKVFTTIVTAEFAPAE